MNFDLLEAARECETLESAYGYFWMIPENLAPVFLFAIELKFANSSVLLVVESESDSVSFDRNHEDLFQPDAIKIDMSTHWLWRPFVGCQMTGAWLMTNEFEHLDCVQLQFLELPSGDPRLMQLTPIGSELHVRDVGNLKKVPLELTFEKRQFDRLYDIRAPLPGAWPPTIPGALCLSWPHLDDPGEITSELTVVKNRVGTVGAIQLLIIEGRGVRGCDVVRFGVHRDYLKSDFELLFLKWAIARAKLKHCNWIRLSFCEDAESFEAEFHGLGFSVSGGSILLEL